MKKGTMLFIIIGLLLIPSVLADNVEVIIEHKSPQPQINTFSLKNLNSEISNERFEIKNVSPKEFEQLKEDPNIIIQENIPKHITLDASVPLIGADKVWNLKENQTNITGESQTVCVLDTGAQTNHPALIGKNATCNIDCITDSDNCIENCSITDEQGHGTHVAGIIVSSDSTYHGVTLNTKYIPVVTCDSAGSCPNTAIWAGMEWCIENKEQYNISVISMSLGEGQFDSYCDIERAGDAQRVNNATLNNITVVAATGNTDESLGITNHSDGISNPACIQNSTRAGNTDNSDNMANSGLRHHFFSDIITAPGVDVTSTYPTDIFASATGTSMSTPHVSGSIALLNQYKKLESNTTLTPSEIKQLILNSGKTIYDSDTDQNYTRIKTYETIITSDDFPPQINLITPQNSLLTIPSNQTFSCNATDMQLKNLTLQIFNSTDLIYNITNSSPIENTLKINQTFNLSETDNYKWNCYSYDNQSNYKISSNYTISTFSVLTNINSPGNNTYTNQNETTFNCSAQTSLDLTNITFSIYNSTALLNTSTKNITGKDNQTTFNYTLENETTYYFNCLAKNNESYSDQTENYSITYDITSPKINLTSPANNTRTQTKTHTFQFNETELNKDFCNLTINSNKYSDFTQTLSDGTYFWNVSCTDKANNTNISETYKLEIYTEVQEDDGGSSSGGGGGGGSPDLPETYTIDETDVKQGTEKTLKEDDSIEFIIKSNPHKITLSTIGDGQVNITITSTPIETTLYLNKPKKFDLDSDNFLDLELILTQTNDEATIFIKEITEEVPKMYIQNETMEITNQTNKTQPQEPKEEKLNFFQRLFQALSNFLDKIKSIFR